MAQGIDIQVISLARATSRRGLARAQLDPTKLAWEFVDAVDGHTLAVVSEYDRKRRLRHKGFDMSTGEIACFLSHRTAWKRSVDRQKPSLILEDDFALQKELREVLSLAETHQDAYDVLRLHGAFARKQKIVRALPHGKHIVKYHKDPSAALAYVVTPDAATALLRTSETLYLTVDNFIGATWLHRLRVRGLLPYPVMPSAAHDHTTITDRPDPKLGPHRKILRECYRIPTAVRAAAYRWRTFAFG
jgi:glycosyl transferase, family 25